MQQRVHEEVVKTRERSGWPADRTLEALGICRRSYYRWLKTKPWLLPPKPSAPVGIYEALPEEKEKVLAYARTHAELRHRELAWQMIDEEVAFLSASTVYRILKEADLVCPWRRRTKRRREMVEKPSRPDERWVTDLMQIVIGGEVYYLVSFMDEYSRYIVHHELVMGMDGKTVSLAAQSAIDRLPKGEDGRPLVKPVIQSDNGSGYIAREFLVVLKENGLCHHRIRPHCPEENGTMERAYRTLREALEEEELANVLEARESLAKIVRWYNEERLHSALGYMEPAEFYRGNPAARQEERRRKMAEVRKRRKETNLALRQRTIPFSEEPPVSKP